MIYFLYGNDSFSSQAKLVAIRQKFLSVHPQTNLLMKTAAELERVNLTDLVAAQTLLGTKQLIIIRDVLSAGSDDLKQRWGVVLRQPLSDDVTLIFHESDTFDRRQSLFKLLNQPGQAQEFVALQGIALQRQVMELANQRGVKLSTALLAELVHRTEADLWRIDNELSKLAASSAGQTINQQLLDDLVPSPSTENIFQLVDQLLAGQLATARQLLLDHLTRGENEIRTLGSIAYQLRARLRVHDLMSKQTPTGQIARLTGLPPFVVTRMARSFQANERSRLVAAYQSLVSADHQIKTGGQPPIDALDALVVALAS
jgi:DNA polymerase III delta subunit